MVDPGAPSVAEVSRSNEPARHAGDVQSVVRALRLLELVAEAKEIGVTELAREAGLVVSTTHSLVRTLTRQHYLVGTAGRYRLGPAATALASGWDPAATFADQAGPVLDALAERTDFATTGTVLVGREARIIGYAAAPGPITATASGLRWRTPLGLATGRVLVAFCREDDWAEIVGREGEVEPRWSQRRWLNELRAVQRTGICLKSTGDRRSVAGLAVPVWAHGGTVVASIGCSAPGFLVDDLVRPGTVAALWEASRDLSARLGCQQIPLTPDPDPFSQLVLSTAQGKRTQRSTAP